MHCSCLMNSAKNVDHKKKKKGKTWTQTGNPNVHLISFCQIFWINRSSKRISSFIDHQGFANSGIKDHKVLDTLISIKPVSRSPLFCISSSISWLSFIIKYEKVIYLFIYKEEIGVKCIIRVFFFFWRRLDSSFNN